MSTRELSGAINQPARSNMTRGVDRILDMPRVRVSQPGGQSIPSASTAAVISFSFLSYDTDSMWNAASPTKVTIRTKGVYDVKQYVFYAGDGTGISRQSWVGVNGTVNRYAYDQRPPNASFGRVGGSDTMTLNVGDYLELHAYQDTAGALVLAPSAGLYNGAELLVTLLSTRTGVE